MTGAGPASRTMRTACFVADTPVLLWDGATQPIDEIEPGDTVWSRDPETGEFGCREVVALKVTPEQRVLSVEVSTAEGGSEVFGVTAEVEEDAWSGAASILDYLRREASDGAGLNAKQRATATLLLQALDGAQPGGAAQAIGARRMDVTFERAAEERALPADIQPALGLTLRERQIEEIYRDTVFIPREEIDLPAEFR